MIARHSIVILFIALLSCVERETATFKVSSRNAEAESVYLTQNESGMPVLAWTERANGELRFLFTTLDNNGAAGEKYEIPVPDDVATHAEGMPKVAFKKDGTVIAAYETKAPTSDNKYAGAIYFIESYDRGRSWTSPTYLHNDTISGRSRSFFDIETLSDGEVGAAWLDIKLNSNSGGRSIRFSKTTAGSAFVSEILIDSSACECCRVDLHSTKNGDINIAYRGIIKGNVGQSIRDMMFVTSGDNGKTFTNSKRISADNWVIDGCPHTGPSLASNGNGTHALWYTEGTSTGISYSFAEAKPAHFVAKENISPAGKHPQIAAQPGRVALLWEENMISGSESHSRVRYQLRDESGIHSEYITAANTDAYLPVVTTLNAGEFIVAYLMKEKEGSGAFVCILN
jgi:hypothetical protein